MSFKSRRGLLLHDLLLIAISVGAALFLLQTGFFVQILGEAKESQLFGSFVAGLFFTSIFTTAPAIVALGELTQLQGILPVALVGALGSVIGDLILFRFIRDRFSEHLFELVGHRNARRKIKAFFHLRLFRWLSLFIGGLIIASPLPDELGISLLGFSKIRSSWFIPLSYAFNFLGIVLIGLVAHSI
jgi:hypothetical protein